MTTEKLNQLLTRDSKFTEPLTEKEKATYLDSIVEHKDYVEAINYLESIYLNRLKEQYKMTKQEYNGLEMTRYNAMRLFCLDTQLISLNNIKSMESEVNSVF